MLNVKQYEIGSVVVAKKAELSLPIPEVLGSNPVIGEIL